MSCLTMEVEGLFRSWNPPAVLMVRIYRTLLFSRGATSGNENDRPNHRFRSLVKPLTITEPFEIWRDVEQERS